MSSANQTHSKAPFLSIIAVFAVLVLFALFYVVLQQGVWTFVVFVIVIIALAFIGVWLYHLAAVAWIKVAGMRLSAIEENHRYELARAKLNYEYRLGIPAPAPQPERMWKPELEKYRNAAINIVALTCDTLGQDSKTLISHNKAVELNNAPLMSGSVFQTGLDFLTGNLLACVMMRGGRQEGTAINDGLTAGQLLDLLTPRKLQVAR